MAAKLARLLYRMLRYGMKYADQGAELYDAQYRKQQVIHSKRKTAQLGCKLSNLLHPLKATNLVSDWSAWRHVTQIGAGTSPGP